jgi:mono/diheme cytochrome c family protein
MTRLLAGIAVVLTTLALVPLALVWRSRSTTSPFPRWVVVTNMAKQPKLVGQAAFPLFADGRAMRPPAEGTVVRGSLSADPVLETGRKEGRFVDALPVAVTPQLLKRGQERYDIFCSPCHGLSGYGDGVVSRRADLLQEGTWTPPSSLHTDLVRSRPAGQLFNTVTNGIRNMPAYGAQVPPPDRWAIVAYVRALQRSQHAALADAAPEAREKLEVTK